MHITLDPLEGFFLKFCTLKRDNSDMKMILITLKDIKCLGKMGHFGSKNGASSQLWINCKKFLSLLHNEKGQQVDESNNTDLYQKILFRTNGSFCARKWHIQITLGQP